MQQDLTSLLRPSQMMKTHRLSGLGTSQRSVDHPVLLDWACGWLPANIQCVDSGVEDLDVSDRASWHCQNVNDGW